MFGNKQKLIDALASGNRPIRIFLFGGIIVSYVVMQLLGRLLGVVTDIDDEFHLPAILLIAVSLLAGFGSSFSVVYYLESHSSESAEEDE